MRDTIYEGPQEGQYDSKNFINMMDHVLNDFKSDHLDPLLNELIYTNNSKLPETLLNVWHVHGVAVIWDGKYLPFFNGGVKDISAKVILDGDEPNYSKVKDKIQELGDKVTEFSNNQVF